MPAASTPGRSPRRDAQANQERLVAAAIEVIAREGVTVPLSVIADAAGVGIGTFYRRFPDRASLLAELADRAYADLNGILDELLAARQLRGIDAVRAFLEQSVAIGDRLILPLRGAPPVNTQASRGARRSITTKLDALLNRGRQDGSIRATATAIDIAVASAILTQPPRGGHHWDTIAARHVAVYVAGLGAGTEPPGGPPVHFDHDRRTLRPAPADQPSNDQSSDPADRRPTRD